MAQISLYVDDDVLASLKERAAARGVSVSRLTSQIIEADRRSSTWPEGWFDLAGCLADDASFVEPPDTPLDELEPIEPLEVLV